MDDFHEMVEALTQDHVVVLPEGDEPISIATGQSSRFQTVPGLLQQLSQAAVGGNGNRRSGGGASSKATIPIDAGAIDLLECITGEIVHAWRDAHPQAKVLPFGDPWKWLRQWAATRPDANDTINGYRVDDWLASMVQRISDYFDPPRHREVTGACPSCGEMHVMVERDEETYRESALVIILDRHTGESQALRCRACGDSWDRGQIERVARIITGNTTEAAELIS